MAGVRDGHFCGGVDIPRRRMPLRQLPEPGPAAIY